MWTHGASGYSNFKCRCDICKMGHADYVRNTPKRNLANGIICSYCLETKGEKKGVYAGTLCRPCYVRERRNGTVVPKADRRKSEYELPVNYGHKWWWVLYNIARGRSKRVMIDASDLEGPTLAQFAHDVWLANRAEK